MDYFSVRIPSCVRIQFLYNPENNKMEEGIAMKEKTKMTEEEYEKCKWGAWEKPVFIIASALFSYLIVGLMLLGWLKW